ncbi:MAG: methionine--tRNA ligase, partial [Gemmataceae bacterium]
RPLNRRSEPCYYFKLSAFQDRLLAFLKDNPDFVQPDSRRNEMIGFIEAEGLQDLNISRAGEEWGIRMPFDEEFTIYVWFDALLTYITGIGYEDNPPTFEHNWPADIHFIGKDITRFHCHIWPAMLWAAGLEAPRKVFSHGFVYFQGDKIGKSRIDELKAKGLDYLLEPMEIIKKFSSDAFRYYFLRDCPYPGDGNIDPDQFIKVYNSDLANKLGNLLSRCITVGSKSFDSVLAGTAAQTPEKVSDDFNAAAVVQEVRKHLENCDYNLALQTIILKVCMPADQYIDAYAPWKLVKGSAEDKERAKKVIFNVIHSLRIAAILLKPFIPRSAEAIYKSFNFATPWEEVTFADAAALTAQPEDLRVLAELVDGKPKPLFPRLN